MTDLHAEAGDDGLRALGWDEDRASEFGPHARAGLTAARVIAVHRGTSVVRRGQAGDDGGEPGDRPMAVSAAFRTAAPGPAAYPAIGDWVAITPAVPGSPAVIEAVLARRTEIRRAARAGSRRAGRPDSDQVLAANVDVAMIVGGLDGDLNLRRLERYLAVAWSSGAAPVVLLNKTDLEADPAERAAVLTAVATIAPGVAVVPVSARTGAGLADLGTHLRPGRTAVLLGSSGVGKSTLVNALLGEERQSTGAVREADARGRHTTSHRELFALPGGALLIDTPGLRSLDVSTAGAGMEATFPDIEALAAECRFRDCGHETEPDCAVQRAVAEGMLAPERVAAHRKLEREVAHVARAADPRAQATERRRWKTIHKAVGRQLKDKYGEDPQ